MEHDEDNNRGLLASPAFWLGGLVSTIVWALLILIVARWL